MMFENEALKPNKRKLLNAKTKHTNLESEAPKTWIYSYPNLENETLNIRKRSTSIVHLGTKGTPAEQYAAYCGRVSVTDFDIYLNIH